MAIRVFVALAVLLAGSAGHAASVAVPMALAVIEATVSGAQCTVTAPDGVNTQAPCEAAGWTPALLPGWSAQMTATIDYRYSDDGLALTLGGAGPYSFGFQLDPYGFSNLFVDHESAAIYTPTSFSRCFVRLGPCGNFYETESGEHGFPPVFVSNNDFAEALSGQLSVSTAVRWDPPGIFEGRTYQPTLFIGVRTQVHSVPAIPEPSTWALMVGPLLGLGWLSRRRGSARPS